MASASSKAIPFVSLSIAFILVLIHAEYGVDVQLGTLLPLLTATGIAGVPLSIVKKAIEAQSNGTFSDSKIQAAVNNNSNNGTNSSLVSASK